MHVLPTFFGLTQFNKLWFIALKNIPDASAEREKMYAHNMSICVVLPLGVWRQELKEGNKALRSLNWQCSDTIKISVFPYKLAIIIVLNIVNVLVN